jgi:hypothetical protein
MGFRTLGILHTIAILPSELSSKEVIDETAEFIALAGYPFARVTNSSKADPITFDSRHEPDAGTGYVGICATAPSNLRSYRIRTVFNSIA